jgi:hypothetical protein
VVCFHSGLVLFFLLARTTTSMSQIQKVHLTYFPLRGVVEKLRLVLEAGGIPYEETRYFLIIWLFIIAPSGTTGVFAVVEAAVVVVGEGLTRGGRRWWHNPTPG